MDSLSFDNLRHILVLACTIVLANVLFVPIPPGQKAEPHQCFSSTNRHLKAVLTSRDSSSIMTRLTSNAIKDRPECENPEHSLKVAIKGLTGIFICSRTISHF